MCVVGFFFADGRTRGGHVTAFARSRSINHSQPKQTKNNPKVQAKRMQHCWIMLQYVEQGWPNERNTVQHGGQTPATCCVQQCFTMLRQHVASVWSELNAKNTRAVTHRKPVRNEAFGSCGAGPGRIIKLSIIIMAIAINNILAIPSCSSTGPHRIYLPV